MAYGACSSCGCAQEECECPVAAPATGRCLDAYRRAAGARRRPELEATLRRLDAAQGHTG